jgi:uncharacterized protein
MEAEPVALSQQGSVAALVVDVLRIPDEGLPLEVAISTGELRLPEASEVAFPAPVKLLGRVTRIAEQVYFQGTVAGTMTTPCSRCVEPSRHDFEVEMQVMFLPPGASDSREDPEAVGLEEEPDVYVHDGMKLELAPPVYDQVVLAFPVQPLCRPDCAGLCQVCGGNRNATPCGCRAESGDQRFALLNNLAFSDPS